MKRSINRRGIGKSGNPLKKIPPNVPDRISAGRFGGREAFAMFHNQTLRPGRRYGAHTTMHPAGESGLDHFTGTG